MNAPVDAPKPLNKDWAAPLFLLSPPLDPAIGWRFAAPSLEAPVCQMPTVGQVDSLVFERFRALLRIRAVPHRRNWEQVWLLAMAEAAGALAPGGRAIGFGVGQENLPSAIASLGLEVLATDIPPEHPAAPVWAKANQLCTGAGPLHRPAILDEAAFAARVRFQPADIAAPGKELAGRFDLAWSCNVLGQLGSVAAALDAVEASLAVLRPGGVAVHTVSLLLSENEAMPEARTNLPLRRRDVEHLLSRLVSAGHAPWPLNLHPGDEEGDDHLDAPPYALPHLKVRQGEQVVTSFGLAVRRRAQ